MAHAIVSPNAPIKTDKGLQYQKVSKIIGKEIVNEVNNKLTQWSEYAKAILQAYNSAAYKGQGSENVILFGPAGYGKSDGALIVAKELKKRGYVSTDPFVISFNQATTEDKIFGGIDAKKLLETGVQEYLYEHSMFAYEIVIIEEMLDAFPEVLLALKDTLTSGYIQNGTQRIPIRTKMIIGLTNKAPETIVENDSYKAILERFQVQQIVQWSAHDKDAYKNALIKSFNKGVGADLICTLGSELVVSANLELKRVKGGVQSHSIEVSPRTAYKVTQLLLANDYEDLINFDMATLPMSKTGKSVEVTGEIISKFDEFCEPIRNIVEIQCLKTETITKVVQSVLTIYSTSIFKHIDKKKLNSFQRFIVENADTLKNPVTGEKPELIYTLFVNSKLAAKLSNIIKNIPTNIAAEPDFKTQIETVSNFLITNINKELIELGELIRKADAQRMMLSEIWNKQFGMQAVRSFHQLADILKKRVGQSETSQLLEKMVDLSAGEEINNFFANYAFHTQREFVTIMNL